SDRRRAAMSSPHVLHPDPELPDDERRAGEHHELGEIPPRDVMILRPVDREILPPLWLRMPRATIRRTRDLLGIAQPRIRARIGCASRRIEIHLIGIHIRCASRLLVMKLLKFHDDTSTSANGSSPIAG